ncbi:hypothetical protein [Reichenbachiella sp.]|uniref:hypothetical protein n=1 Tax=Reichenbachiella sp. TaxID=2184521 RepID=UPI003299FC66
MNQRQINHLEMFQTTNDYLEKQAAVWNAIPIIGNYKNQLNTTQLAIKQIAADQADAQVHIGKSVMGFKKTIAEKMDYLDDLLEAYGEDVGNAELVSQAHNSKTDYVALPYENFETKVKQVIGLLAANLNDMTDYGLTAEQIEDVKLDLDQFLASRGKPRSYQVASRQATQSLESLFEQGKECIVKLDRVLKRYKRANASFYNGYLSASKVVND